MKPIQVTSQVADTNNIVFINPDDISYFTGCKDSNSKNRTTIYLKHSRALCVCETLDQVANLCIARHNT